jgi:hypothetical protein
MGTAPGNEDVAAPLDQHDEDFVGQSEFEKRSTDR